VVGVGIDRDAAGLERLGFGQGVAAGLATVREQQHPPAARADQLARGPQRPGDVARVAAQLRRGGARVLRGRGGVGAEVKHPRAAGARQGARLLAQRGLAGLAQAVGLVHHQHLRAVAPAGPAQQRLG